MAESSFPVFFFDGTTTVDIGCIFIKPSLNFKTFQSAVSQKIGISHNQITIYYERRPLNTSPSTKTAGNRRIPVTNLFSFASILRDRNARFFAILKRTRRDRYRRKRRAVDPGGDLAFGNLNFTVGPTNSPYAAVDYLDYRSQEVKRMVERARERFLLSLSLNSNLYSDLDVGSRMSFRGGGFSGAGEIAPLCEVCDKANSRGETAPFHLCNCDRILTTPFRSPFGPIARPVRTGLGPISRFQVTT